MTDSPATAAFRAARDLLQGNREDYDAAVAAFRWPELEEFNFGLDWFDVLAAEQPDTLALRVLNETSDATLTYAELKTRSDQAANWLRGLGARRGDRILLMLSNIVPLWEVILAAIKLGAVVIPASTLLGPDDLKDRLDRGKVRHVVTETALAGKFDGLRGDWTPIAVSGPAGPDTAPGWQDYAGSAQADADFTPDGVTKAGDPLLLYFTSGTTSLPKLVGHTHVSYPVGHLTTMYYLGLRPGDVHCNISSPGWAKHAWSNVFAPWIAGSTALVLGHERFSVDALFSAIPGCGMTSLCAPPTVWRMIVQADMASVDIASLTELLGAGEPLNPEVIAHVKREWGITIRDGYGQTETTLQVGNSPGQPVKPGSMGRPMPGYDVVLLDPLSGEPAAEGEICLSLDPRPLGLMTGYQDDPERAAAAMAGGHYHTGDVASRDGDGYITYVGRTDDVFKASDYRISPFELESVLIEHEAVAEAAVVPSPDPVRLAVPKAYVTLSSRAEPTPETAESILRFTRDKLSAWKRIRRIEFADLPKTISGKIRRVELRQAEEARHGGSGDGEAADSPRGKTEFWEEDFPGLKS